MMKLILQIVSTASVAVVGYFMVMGCLNLVEQGLNRLFPPKGRRGKHFVDEL